MTDNRFPNPGTDSRFAVIGVDDRFKNYPTDNRFPSPGTDTRFGQTLGLILGGGNGFLLDTSASNNLFKSYTIAASEYVVSDQDPIGFAVDDTGAVTVTESVKRPALGLTGTFDYYIDDANGNDANDGSEGSPWQSLSMISNSQFVDGVTVRYRIKAGTYDKVNDLIFWAHAFAGSYQVEIVCEVGCVFDGTAASVASSSFFDPQGPADVTVNFFGNGAVVRNFTNGTGNGLGGRGSLKYSAYDFEIYNCADGLSTHEDCQADFYRCYAHDCTKAPIAHIDNTVSKHFGCLISSSASSSGVILISSTPAEFTDCTLLVDGGDDRIALDNGVFERCQIGSTTENWRCSGASLGDKGTVTDSYVNVTGDISRAVDFTNCFGTLSYRQRNGGLGMTIDGCVLDGAIVNSNYNPGGGSVLNLTNNVFLASTVGSIDATNAGYLNAAGSVFSNNTLESGSWDADLLAELTITGTESGPTNVGSADSVDMADWLTPSASAGRGIKTALPVGETLNLIPVGQSSRVFDGLGAEIVTNSTFDTDVSGWNNAAGTLLTWNASGYADIARNGASYGNHMTQLVTTDAGEWYVMKVVVAALSHQVVAQFDSTAEFQFTIDAPGTYEYFVQASGTLTEVEMNASADTFATASFDEISVKSASGVHAFQPTAGDRPLWNEATGSWAFNGVNHKIAVDPSILPDQSNLTLAGVVDVTAATNGQLGGETSSGIDHMLRWALNGDLPVTDSVTSSEHPKVDGVVMFNLTQDMLYRVVQGTGKHFIEQRGADLVAANWAGVYLGGHPTNLRVMNGDLYAPYLTDISDADTLDRAAVQAMFEAGVTNRANDTVEQAALESTTASEVGLYTASPRANGQWREHNAYQHPSGSPKYFNNLTSGNYTGTTASVVDDTTLSMLTQYANRRVIAEAEPLTEYTFRAECRVPDGVPRSMSVIHDQAASGSFTLDVATVTDEWTVVEATFTLNASGNATVGVQDRNVVPTPYNMEIRNQQVFRADLGGTQGSDTFNADAPHSPADTTYLYQDDQGGDQAANGTDVGLVLSHHTPDGPDSVTNGNFDTDTDWTKGPSWSISGGMASKVAGASAESIQQNVGLQTGKRYRVSFTGFSTNTSWFIRMGAGANTYAPAAGDHSGDFSVILTADGAGDLQVRGVATTVMSFSSISVQEVIGIPFLQATAGDRGQLDGLSGLIDFDGVSEHMTANLSGIADRSSMYFACLVQTTDTPYTLMAGTTAGHQVGIGQSGGASSCVGNVGSGSDFIVDMERQFTASRDDLYQATAAGDLKLIEFHNLAMTSSGWDNVTIASDVGYGGTTYLAGKLIPLYLGPDPGWININLMRKHWNDAYNLGLIPDDAPLSFTFETATRPFGTGNDLIIDVPAGAKNQDLLVAVLGSDNTQGTNPYTPTGWNLVYHGGDTTSDCTITVYSRVADGTEGASVNFGGGTANDMGGALYLIPGGGAVSAGTGATLNGSTITAPAITTAAANSLVFAIGAQDGGDTTGTTFTVGSGYTEDTEILSGNGAGAGFGMVIGSNTQAAAGASPTVDITSTRSDGMHAVQIAVAPA